jgi:hypothetical protein
LAENYAKILDPDARANLSEAIIWYSKRRLVKSVESNIE